MRTLLFILLCLCSASSLAAASDDDYRYVCKKKTLEDSCKTAQAQVTLTMPLPWWVQMPADSEESRIVRGNTRGTKYGIYTLD